LGRSVFALAISALMAAGICACEPTLSEAVTNLPSTMTSGTDTLKYNLYTTVARNVVWGDDSGDTDLVGGTGADTITLGAGVTNASIDLGAGTEIAA